MPNSMAYTENKTLMKTTIHINQPWKDAKCQKPMMKGVKYILDKTLEYIFWQ